MSLADTAGGGLWNAFLGGRQQAQQEGTANLQNVGALQAVLARAKQDQLANAFRDEMSRATTPDEQAAVAVKFGDPTHVLANATRVAGIKGTQEMARARLTQALQLADMTHQDRMRSATTAEARAAESARHNGIVEAIQRDALANAGARLAYDTGATPSNSFAAVVPPPAGSSSPVPPAGVAAPQQGVTIQGSFPEADANIVGASPSLLAAAAQKDPTLAAVLSRAGVGGLPQPQPSAAPEAPVAAPAPVSAPQPDAGNLDARDLALRGAAGTPQPIPNAAPGPLPAAPVSAVPQPQSAIPPMPPEVAKMPKKFQDAWTLDQAKKGTAGNTASENIVDLIGQGKMAVPSSFALRSPYWIDALERVGKKYPGFDAGVYGARASARRTFASGPEAKNVTSMNTLIGHLGTMSDMADKLNNNDYPAANAVINRIKQEMGDPTIVNFNTAKSAVAEETMRVFRQVGASDAEAKRWGDLLSSSGSPAQLSGNISTVGKLLESRINAIADQFERTVNQSGNPAKIMPGNQTILDKMVTKDASATGGWSIRPKQ